MEIEDLKQIVEHAMPGDPDRLLDELIHKAVVMALKRIYEEGSKWIRENQEKKKKLKGGG